MKKFIQLQDSYTGSKKGDIWKQLYNPYINTDYTLYENIRTIERLEEGQMKSLTENSIKKLT